MSNAVVVATVRNSVNTVIAAQEFNGGGGVIVPMAIYDIYWNLAQLTGGRILTMPTEKDQQIMTRAGTQLSEVTIEVCLQYKYKEPTSAELDPYLQIMETIAAPVSDGGVFLGNQQPIAGNFFCLEAKFIDGLWLKNHVKDFRVFSSMVALSFMQRI
jgi:hypothetical protein